MALKFVIEKLEDVAEHFRGEYKQRSDGKFQLDTDENVDDLKKNLQKANGEAAQRRQLIDKWEKLGKTPEEIQALLEDAQKREIEKAEKAGEWDKLKAQMLEQHQKELADLRKELDTTKTRAHDKLKRSEAATALAGAKGSVKILLPHVLDRVKVVDDNGEEVVRVVDEKGDPRIGGDGKFLTVADLINEMKADKEYSRAFEGASGSGGGMPSDSGKGSGGGSAGTQKRSEMSITERTAFIKEKGRDEYMKLPA